MHCQGDLWSPGMTRSVTFDELLVIPAGAMLVGSMYVKITSAKVALKWAKSGRYPCSHSVLEYHAA